MTSSTSAALTFARFVVVAFLLERRLLDQDARQMRRIERGEARCGHLRAKLDRVLAPIGQNTREQLIETADQRRMGAEGLRQRDEFAAAVEDDLLHILENTNIRPAKGVDALFGVADDEQRAGASLGQRADNRPLRRIRVLEFVHQHIADFRASVTVTDGQRSLTPQP